MAAADVEVFLNFFGGSRERLDKTISGFDIDRLKPVRNFLVGKSGLSRREAANLAAVLVGMEPRPFGRFRGSEIKIPSDQIRRDPKERIYVSVANNRKSWAASVVGAITVAAGFGMAGYFTAPECMSWNGNQYIEVECDQNNPVLLVEPMDEKRFGQMKKIVPCDTVTFFRNDKPAVWYDKHKKKVEFFTLPGLHPETGRTLKPVTDYMVRKYSGDCN